MKNRVFSALLMCIIFTASVFAQEKKASEKELSGTWSYTMQHPMGGEEKGSCVFSKENNQTIATFNTSMVSSPLVLKEKGVYTATAESQGYPLSLTFKVNGDKIDCEMDAGVAAVSLTMVKEK